MQKLIQELELHGCIVVADALNCQKETASLIVKGKADYLLSVKDNQPTLKNDIAEYIQDEALQAGLEKVTRVEKNRDRIEKRTAYITADVNWLPPNRHLSATDLLHHARMEWAVESMHWLLDIHFDEDGCRAEDKNVQKNLNMLHKAALNTVKQYQSRTGQKRPMSKIMFDCLLDCSCLAKVLGQS